MRLKADYVDSLFSLSMRIRRAGSDCPHFQSTRLIGACSSCGEAAYQEAVVAAINRRANVWVTASPFDFIWSRHVACASRAGLTPSALSAASFRQSKTLSISASYETRVVGWRLPTWFASRSAVLTRMHRDLECPWD